MTLPFSTQLNGKPTYFVEKILNGLHGLDGFEGFNLSNKYNHDLDYLETCNQKIHTIREDKSNRWKSGNDIHFVINNRTPNRFQFAPVIKCVSVQSIEIKNVFDDRFSVTVDGVDLTKKQIETLAINDGFDTVDDFWKFFQWEDFTGKIIHWTDLKY